MINYGTYYLINMMLVAICCHMQHYLTDVQPTICLLVHLVAGGECRHVHQAPHSRYGEEEQRKSWNHDSEYVVSVSDLLRCLSLAGSLGPTLDLFTCNTIPS